MPRTYDEDCMIDTFTERSGNCYGDGGCKHSGLWSNGRASWFGLRPLEWDEANVVKLERPKVLRYPIHEEDCE